MTKEVGEKIWGSTGEEREDIEDIGRDTSGGIKKYWLINKS